MNKFVSIGKKCNCWTIRDVPVFCGQGGLVGQKSELEFDAHMGYAHKKFEPAQTRDATPLGWPANFGAE